LDLSLISSDRNLNSSASGNDPIAAIPALLLVGGMGTRLRPVLSSKPKPLAPLGEISFLELLVLQLRAQGMRRMVMCTGFMAEQIQQQLGDGKKWDVAIEYSRETEPLGTAGAIKLAEPHLGSAAQFLVMNGDSFLELDFQKLMRSHVEREAHATIAVRRVPDAARYGTVHVDSRNRVVRFSEKVGVPEPGLINGGVYVFNRDVLDTIPQGPASLEKDVLPGLLDRGVFAVEQNGMFIDIGTPEDYARAQTLFESLAKAALADTSNRGSLDADSSHAGNS
jgi:NDP-sugar pyrophosphorylase family protein